MKVIQKSDFFKVLVSAVTVEKGFNLRGEELPKIDELAQSIATIGQKTPIEGVKVRGKDEFILTAGHRRLAAIKLANEKYIGTPGFLQEPITHVNLMAGSGDEKNRNLTMLLDGQVEKLTTAELAVGFKRLKDEFGMKPAEIGSAVGVSQAQVYNVLALFKAPELVQKLVADGLISVALVNEIQRTTKDADEQIKLAQEAIENANSETQDEQGEPKKVKATSANAKTSKVSADVAKLEKALLIAESTVKASILKAVVEKLKQKASAEEIAELLK